MANIPSIPPLLCSTPPPIDFNDDRDEGDDDTVLPPSLTLDEEYDGGYNAFAGTPPSTYIETNSDVPSLPGTPVQLASANCFESLSDCIKIPTMAEDRYSEFQGNKEAKAMKPIEAFNFAIATAILESNSPPPLDLDGVVSNEEADEEDFQEFCTASQDSDPGGGDMSDDVEEEYSVIKTEDNLSLPSLKFDTLSISSEKFSACSRSSPSPTLLDDQGNSTQIIETLADNKDKASPNETSKFPLDVVQLEDLADDSSDDDGHSPEKGKNYIDENADDFFAIHIINEDNHNVVLDTPSNEIWVKEDPPLNQDNLEFISSKRDMETNREKENPEERRKEKVNEFGDFTDFSVFQCASKSDVNTTNGIEEAELQEPLETQNWDFEDEFDDFQDFTNAATVSNLESVAGKETEPEIQKIPTSSVTTTHMKDSEDEFGDFSDATFTPAPSVPNAVHIQSINIPNPVSSNNVNDKLLPILEMMFPNIDTTSGDFNEETKNIKTSPPEDNAKHLKLDAVDNAKALGYHWTKSDIRHSLIRSLGIDSRNILFGDKWNSSMPRFAANLTFNPLEPLKPQQVHKHSDKAHSNAAQRTANKSKSDVPAVEFDWNTSGLVNPLDGSKEVTHGRETETVHTSQPGTFNASADLQPSHSTLANSDNNDDGKLASNSNLNTTTASPTITDPTTTTAISPIISTDSLGYSINDSGNNIDLSTCPQNETGLVTNPILVSDPVTATTATFAATDTLYINTTTFFAANAFNSKKEYFSDNDLDEVVTTSTFAGPLKETHIYTPSKQDTVGITTKTAPIDFDYEIAAAGIIIDEKVVKKEYRDVEYNPGFVLEFTRAQPSDMQQTNTDNSTIFNDIFHRHENQHHAVLNKSIPSVDVSEVDEEFSDFQYVPATQLQASNVPTTTQQSSQSIAGMRSKDIVTNNRTPTVGRGEMILSPSILLPQAILLESSKPKIEWGDTTANINPEELARIEELFPQPKTEASSHKSSPQHNGYELQTQARQPQNSLSISATIAQKEQQADDDDWTEFVSVPVVEPVFQHQPKPKLRHNHFSSPNNNILITSSINRMQQLEHHASALQTTKSDELTATSEEEWSDFVSSTPQANTEYRALPQFNSAAWQNANFYNNPLSFYQNQTHANGVSKLQHNNNNSMTSNYNNNYNQLYQQQDQHHHQQRQLQLQQQIGIMQDFSTAPPSQRRSANTPIVSERNTQFHVGSAKVAPCISLIPDLGFIAPATPTHTAFINTLPKPSFNMKK